MSLNSLIKLSEASAYNLPSFKITKMDQLFYSYYKLDTSGLNYKCFMIVIYNRNDSGQYYKTMITTKASQGQS